MSYSMVKGAGIAQSVVTRYGLDAAGIESRLGARFSTHVQNDSKDYPVSYTMGTGSLSRR